MPTYRACPLAQGRLFPKEEFGNGWGLSAQADAAGYACRPAAKFETLEEYLSVEVVIYGPQGLVYPLAIGLTPHIASAFEVTRDAETGEIDYAIGAFISQDDLNIIRHRLIQLAESA